MRKELKDQLNYENITSTNQEKAELTKESIS